jgi:hypothetical protein
MPRLATLSCTVLAACGLLTAATAAPASAANPPRMSDLMRDYDLRLSVSMKSNFAFQPDPVGCNGRKPAGYAGAGEEILQMKSPKPVRVTLITAPGADPSVSRKDLKAGFELVGESRRSGEMTHVICDDSHANQTAGCTGRFRMDQKMEMNFFRGKWRIGTHSGPTTRDAIPSCGEKNSDAVFDWDGAVARTGVVMLESAQGPAPLSKLKSRAFTLEARHAEGCDVSYFGLGTCKTEWVYRANFRKAKTKRRG